MVKKVEKVEVDWEKFKKKYRLVYRENCPYFHYLKARISNFGKVPDCVLKNNHQCIGQKGIKSPSVMKLPLNEWNVAATDSKKIVPWLIKEGLTKKGKVSSFGNFLKPTKMVPEKLGTGSKKLSIRDNVPQRGWGGFSSSAGGNRAGNAINCRESTNWLYANRNAPSFPLEFGSTVPPDKMISTMRPSFYNKRGSNGFQDVPSSIYTSGNVPMYNESPYGGAHRGGSLPRPYGPRDNALIKGYPAQPRSEFGQAAFMNQGYDHQSEFGQAAFMNQGYDHQSEFGLLGHPEDKPQFRPHPKRSYKSVYQSQANSDLYLPTWNPYQVDGRSPRQVSNTIAGRAVARRNQLTFGEGPNNVGYRNPMLMYDGAGANTQDFLSGTQYYKPCKMPTKQFAQPTKVRKNTNPTGYLATAKELKYLNKFGRHDNVKSDLRVRSSDVKYKCNKFGVDKKVAPKVLPKKQTWSYPKEPWVGKAGPYTTGMFNSSGGGGGAGLQRVGQPLELYNYMNTPYGGYKYPEFSGPRQWMGGFGVKKATVVAKKVTKKVAKKRSAAPGDTIVVGKGKMKLVRAKEVSKKVTKRV
jgi:hypothetical protein